MCYVIIIPFDELLAFVLALLPNALSQPWRNGGLGMGEWGPGNGGMGMGE